MASVAPGHLTPRKRPRQARAAATLDAIFEATTQLLVADGPKLLTMTRVAVRAGVSIGTMYQYLPHKEALIYALNERYLEALAEKIEVACHAHHGVALDRMVEVLIGTYWRAKTERADVTRALYRSVVEIDNAALIEAFAARIDAATAAMLASACDATIAELEKVTLALVTIIFGTVRNVFERNLTEAATDKLYSELVLMCRSYLKARHHE